MNVWIINHYAGYGQRHFHFAKHLMRLGNEVVVIASSFHHGSYEEQHLAPGQDYVMEEIDTVKFLWLRTYPYSGNDYKRMINMLSFYKSALGPGIRDLERPDIIIGSSMHLLGALAGERLAKRFKVPFVFEVRDLWPQTFMDLTGASRFHPLVLFFEPIERYLYKRAVRIITLLPDAYQHIVSKCADPNKIKWIPNGIDIESNPEPAKPLDDDEDEVKIVYAGSHGLANSLDCILDAASILDSKRYRFKFIGRGLEKQRLINRCEQEKILNIEFVDWMSKNALNKELSDADCFVLNFMDSPLYRWGISPNKLFDYMASARPVVMGANVATSYIDEAKAGITVPSENGVKIAEAIETIGAMSNEERWQMGLRGRRYVEEKHDYARLSEQLEQLLEESIISFKE